MNRHLTILLAAVVSIACSDAQTTTASKEDVKRLAAENAAMEKRVAMLETQFLEVQKLQIREHETARQTDGRLRHVETTLSHAVSNFTPVVYEESGSGATSGANTADDATSPIVAASAVSTPTRSESRNEPREIRDEEIREHCRNQWPTDFRMQAYCGEQQTEAKAKWEASSYSGDVPLKQYEEIRSSCEQQWGRDYRMRNYCVGRQVEGYQQVNR